MSIFSSAAGRAAVVLAARAALAGVLRRVMSFTPIARSVAPIHASCSCAAGRRRTTEERRRGRRLDGGVRAPAPRLHPPPRPRGARSTAARSARGRRRLEPEDDAARRRGVGRVTRRRLSCGVAPAEALRVGAAPCVRRPLRTRGPLQAAVAAAERREAGDAVFARMRRRRRTSLSELQAPSSRRQRAAGRTPPTWTSTKASPTSASSPAPRCSREPWRARSVGAHRAFRAAQLSKRGVNRARAPPRRARVRSRARRRRGMSGVVSLAQPGRRRGARATALEEGGARRLLARRGFRARSAVARQCAKRSSTARESASTRAHARAGGGLGAREGAGGRRRARIALGSPRSRGDSGRRRRRARRREDFVKREKFFEDGAGWAPADRAGGRARATVAGAVLAPSCRSSSAAPDRRAWRRRLARARSRAAPALRCRRRRLLLAADEAALSSRACPPRRGAGAARVVLRCIEAADLGPRRRGPRVAAASRLVPATSARAHGGGRCSRCSPHWRRGASATATRWACGGVASRAARGARVPLALPDAAPSARWSPASSTWHIWKSSTAPVLVERRGGHHRAAGAPSAEAASTRRPARPRARPRVRDGRRRRRPRANAARAALRHALGGAGHARRRAPPRARPRRRAAHVGAAASGAADARLAPASRRSRRARREYRRFGARRRGADDDSALLARLGASRVRKLVERAPTLAGPSRASQARAAAPDARLCAAACRAAVAAAPVGAASCTFSSASPSRGGARREPRRRAPKTIDRAPRHRVFSRRPRLGGAKPRRCPSAHVAVRGARPRADRRRRCGDALRVLAAIGRAQATTPGGEEEAARRRRRRTPRR